MSNPKIEHLPGGKEALSALYPFGGKHGAKREAVAVMRGMLEFDHIYFRVIDHGMGTRYVFDTEGFDQQLVILYAVARKIVAFRAQDVHPFLFVIHIADDALGNSNSGAAGRIQLFGMVYLFNLHVIIRVVVHQLGQYLIDMKKDVNPDTKV